MALPGEPGLQTGRTERGTSGLGTVPCARKPAIDAPLWKQILWDGACRVASRVTGLTPSPHQQQQQGQSFILNQLCA